ncbi:MAG: hypothetical protein AAGE65_11665 [Planctomycetota bacterium]
MKRSLRWFLRTPGERRGPLMAMPWAAFVADLGFTLLGQPDAYWQGDYTAHREANPVGQWWLAWHPLAFAAAGLIYGLLMTGLIYAAARWLACWIAVAWTIAHLTGAMSWVPYISPDFNTHTLVHNAFAVWIAACLWLQLRFASRTQ